MTTQVSSAGRFSRNRRGSAMKTVIWVLVGLAVVGLLVCGGAGYGLLAWTSSIVEDAAQEAFADHPLVQKEIGQWQSSSANIMKGGKYGRELDASAVALDVQGSEGTTTLIILNIDEDGYDRAFLETDHGRVELE